MHARYARFSRLLHFVGLLALAGLILASGARNTQARLDPYYVLRGLGSGDVRPRILFVVDTSGSMSWRATAADQQCDWGDCETRTDTRESRISAARRTINNVISATGETASFSLMSFDQYDPPTWTPTKCANDHRFAWVTDYGYFWWNTIWTYPGIRGAWRLCQGSQQRPYPYLRWDDLGRFATVNANHQSGDIPASPLIGSNANDSSNADRRVQWFPRFMGVRAQLNADTDSDRRILGETYGDYGSDDTSRGSNVWGHDFYYWPYVDGFPHYAGYVLWPYDNGLNAGGVIGQNSSVNEAKLYAPFYLDLSESGIAEASWGPSTADEASAAVLDKTAPLIEGGIDAAGGTPWASVIGDVTDAYPLANTEGSHRSVASYLSFVTAQSGGGVCAPTAAVLLTDGVPSPADQGGSTLYGRLASLRRELGVQTYVVGFFQSTGEINNMACSAAGGCDGGSCGSPCDDEPASDWDTCANPDDPGNGCAYLANSSDELAAVLTGIVTAALEVNLSSGSGATANEFGVGAAGAPGQGEALQTSLQASTTWPGWRGSVRRALCEHRDGDGELRAQCQVPSPEWSVDEREEVFGPCPQSHSWDAGACLQDTAWTARRIYTTTGSGKLLRVYDDEGIADDAFRTLLVQEGIISAPNEQDKANAVAAFIGGRDWSDGWKLPGLASSTPTLVRRIPPLRTSSVPSVAIRDPHCGGRRLSAQDAGSLPQSLEDFAREAWGTRHGGGAGHYEYQEAVLIGDDMGMLHAFQYNSGNEIWGYLPRSMLRTAAKQAEVGAAASGQPEALDEHIYGISSTVNVGWVYDDSDADEAKHQWRHLAVFGYGPGGHDYVALDVSHMSPESAEQPIEVLWTTDDDDHAATYKALLGETWARPSLSFHVPGDDMANEPQGFLVVGSGYGDEVGGQAGRYLLRIEATTGDLLERVDVGAPDADGLEDAFGLVGDSAVATHCLSRFWGEAQEAYVADPAGRIFRWDLGRETAHKADSGGTWGSTAKPAAQFRACLGRGSTCTISAENAGEPFVFAPAVTANDRIDDESSAGSGQPSQGTDQFLVALVSGSHTDSAVNPADGSNSFHASLYLLADDHRGDGARGFEVPSGAPKMKVADVGTDPGYMRLVLSDISRERRFVPYPGAAEITETRNFSANTRPIRSPRIVTRGVVDSSGESPVVVDGVEVVEITYFVHEPPTESCDPRFYDTSTQTWHVDQGATFELSFQLSVESGAGFNFQEGASEDSVTFSSPHFERGLSMTGVEQSSGGACEDGNCGPEPDPTPNVACDNNDGESPGSTSSYVVPLTARQIGGFSPVEG